MATVARERLARTLRGEAQAAFSVELTAGTDDLNLEVEGFGQVRFPVIRCQSPQAARPRPAAPRFGRGEETLTDPDVRDTWEIPKHLVRAQWNDATLMDILSNGKGRAGTAERCRADGRSSLAAGLRDQPALPRPPGLRERRLDGSAPWWSPCRPATPAAS